MLNVFLTIDTEFWPPQPLRGPVNPWSGFRRDIYGDTLEGEFGLRYQLELLDRSHLRAVFFVESLFAEVLGPAPLCAMLKMIHGRGHEVQAHLHTEWLAWMSPSLLPGRTGQCLKDFSYAEQVELIDHGLRNLRACGRVEPCAFRAGNYGANFDTLRALQHHGIRFDTSHNTYYLDSQCGLRTPEPLLQPREIQGVYEFPISFFRDGSGRPRHAQLSACSSQELHQVLLSAWQQGWYSFVIVSHSFEFLKRRKQPGRAAVVDRVVLKRFERLCRFLAAHRDKFRTAVFAEVDPATIPTYRRRKPLCSSVGPTMRRYVEQFSRRLPW